MKDGKRGLVLTLAAVLCVSVSTAGLTMAEDLSDTEVVEKDWAAYVHCGADNDYEIAAEFALD